MALESESTWALAVVISDLPTFLNSVGPTIPASKPIMTNTTRSSNKVKPCCLVIEKCLVHC